MQICMDYIIIGRDGKNNKVFCGAPVNSCVYNVGLWR